MSAETITEPRVASGQLVQLATARPRLLAVDEPLSFSTRLRHLRMRAGSTQEELAERAGLSVATIGALEQGRRQPHAHTVGVLARSLALTPDDHAMLLELALDACSQPVVPDPHRSTTDNRERERPAPLPAPLTPLIGREAEVARAVAMLDAAHSDVRLVTLVGPGGVGKTRLALAVMAAIGDHYADGAAFVDLASVRDVGLVPATIARTLNVTDSGADSTTQLLQRHLRDRQQLLVLDNFEHVRDAMQFLGALLQACPRLVVLVTSRTALRLRCEQRFPLSPLAQPAAHGASMEAIVNSAAVRLFVERAQRVVPEFALDLDIAPVVAAICRRLEGMPLAIELAAARANLLRPAELLGRLERRLPLLSAGPADLPERQRTLRHTLAWSYCLLGPVAQTLFRRLAVFAGGWTLEAAEAVCPGVDLSADEVLEALAELVDNSLVQRTADDAELRFDMLETVREYAEERLVEGAEDEAARHRHAAFYLELGEQAMRGLSGPDHEGWLQRLECERDNLRKALNHNKVIEVCKEHSHDNRQQ